MEMRSLVTPCMHSHTVHALPHSACIPTQCMHTVHASNALAETGACIVCATGDRRRDRQGDRRDGLAARSCPRGATHLPPRHRVHRRRAGGQPFTCAYIYTYIHKYTYTHTHMHIPGAARRRRASHVHMHHALRHVHARVHAQVSLVYVYVCMYMYMHMYVYIYIRTCTGEPARAAA